MWYSFVNSVSYSVIQWMAEVVRADVQSLAFGISERML